MKKEITSTVDSISKINFSGNVIPPTWFKTIRFKNKRGSYPNLLAINILADIIYWYRPSVVRDEASGQILEIKKKFSKDLLQRSYDDLANQFGVSYKLARLAVIALEDLGLVRKEIRNIKLENGGVLQNVMFVEPIPAVVERFTFPDSDEPITQLGNRPLPNSVIGAIPNGESAHTELGGTYTEITTETSTESKIVESTNSTLFEIPDASQLNAKKKKIKKEKSGADFDVQAVQVLEYLNEKARRQLPTTGKRSEANKRVIIARLKEGYTADELKKIVDHKVLEWFGDMKMKNCLKPTTLFIPKHVADYLDEANHKSTPVTNGLVYDIDLNGKKKIYEAWWEKMQTTFPNVSGEIRFFKASEFAKFSDDRPEWFPMIHERLSKGIYDKHIKDALAQLESDSNRRRTAQGGLYSYLTTYLSQKARTI